MSQVTDPNEFLLSTGSPAAKFPEIGTAIKGVVRHLEVQQQTDFDTGKPMVWDDGKPRQQLVITLETDITDPSIPDDDGTRRLFAKGLLLQAIRQAVRSSGAQLLEGGTLAVKYTGDVPVEKNGRKLNPAKQYEAAYKPPTPNQGDVDSLVGGGNTAGPSASELL